MKLTESIILFLLLSSPAGVAGQTDSAALYNEINKASDLLIYKNYPKAVQEGEEIFARAKKSECSRCLTRATVLKGKIYWLNGQYKESIELLKEAISVAGKKGDLESIAQASNIIGNNFYWQAYYDSAIFYFQQSYSAYETLQDLAGMAVVVGDISLMYHRKGDFKKTVEYILMDEALKEKFPDTPHEIGDFGGMGSLFSDSLHYEEVIEDNLRALHSQQKKNNLEMVFKIYRNLGIAYGQLKDYKTAARYYVKTATLEEKLGLFPSWDDAGRNYREANMKDSSLYYHYRAKREFKNATFNSISYTNQLLGDAYYHFNQFDSSLHYFSLAMKMSVMRNNRITIVALHRRLGNVCLKLKRYRESEQHILSGLALAKEISVNNERNLYSSATQLYTATGDFKRALHYQSLYSQLIDSLDRQESALALVRLQAQYKTSKKERELGLMKVQNTQNELVLKNRNATLLSLAIISLASIVFIVVFARQRNKIRRKNIALDLYNQEQRALLKEVHHRVKNNLQLIASLINLQSSHVPSPEVARELEKTRSRIMSIALIHQKLYQHENMSSIDLRSFLEDLIGNILTTFSTGVKLEKYVDITPIKVDIETAIPIGLIANELVTNSLKHGLSETVCPELKVRLELVKNKLVLTVSDNGSGISQHPLSDHEGFGLRLVEILLKRMSGTMETTFQHGTHSKIEIANFQSAES